MEAIRAFVLAGFPTTVILQLGSAKSEMAFPWVLKIAPLAPRRSLRSIPGPRGRAPTSKAYWQPRKI